MFKKALLVTSLICISNTLFAAETQLYNQYMSSIAKTEANLAKCIPDEEASPLCYQNADKAYDKIIKDIRKTYGSKVDGKLWQAINVGFVTRKNNCRSSYFDAGTSQVFYPYIDCVHATNHSLVITTVELHLKR